MFASSKRCEIYILKKVKSETKTFNWLNSVKQRNYVSDTVDNQDEIW